MDGLIAYYPFNGNANDESGNNLHGLIMGNLFLTTDRKGEQSHAFEFTGNGWIEIQHNEVFNIVNTNEDFTINTWIYLLENSGGYVFLKDVSSGNASKYIFYTYNSLIGFHTNGNGSFSWNALTTVPYHEWQMVTVVKNGNNLKFFKNGEIISIQDYNGNPVDNTANVRIGGPEPGGEGTWIGKLDDIGVWVRALTEQEIQQLYNE